MKKLVIIKGAKLSSFRSLSLQLNAKSTFTFNEIDDQRIQTLLLWYKTFSGSIKKLSEDVIIYQEMLLEDVLKDERDVFYFQIQSTIKSLRRSYYLGCPNKSCNNSAVVVTNRKFSECKKCKEQIIPKNVLKLQINLGTTEAILWCISFNNVAERLIDYIESLFRIKKSSQYYKVNFN